MHDEDLANLDTWLRQLKIEYHIFFTGNRQKPPDDLKFRVEKLVKRLSESSDLTFSERFRFNTLITRYYVYRDLWRRTQQAKEMGAEPKQETNTTVRTAAKPDKSPGEAVRISISDPKGEEEKVRLLYNALLRVRKAESAETPISYAQFEKYISTQARTIREKYGCSSVAFTIAIEEDTIRFTAAADNR
jgi:hypothetical protein